MKYLIFAVAGYLAGSLIPERIIPREKEGRSRQLLVWALDAVLGFLPVFVGGFFLDKAHPGFILTLLAPAFGRAHPFLQRWQSGHLLALALGSLAGLLPLWQPVVLLAAAAALFFRVIRFDPYVFRVLAVFLVAAGGSFLLLGTEVVSWGCLFLTYYAAGQELEGYQGEKITVSFLPR